MLNKMLYAIYNVLRHIAIDPKTCFKWDWDPRDVIRERDYYIARVAVSYKDVTRPIAFKIYDGKTYDGKITLTFYLKYRDIQYSLFNLTTPQDDYVQKYNDTIIQVFSYSLKAYTLSTKYNICK